MVGLYRSAFKGQGMEFDEVRAYQRGDDVRAIDWNVTARMNHPFIKTYHEERELTVMLVVDVSASSRCGTGERLKSEMIAEIGAVLAFTAIENSDKVGLILFSDSIEMYIPPRKGTRHVLRVIRELLLFRPHGRGTSIEKAVRFLGSVQKRSCVAFLISDFLCDVPKSVIATAAKHDDLIAISVNDPIEWTLPDLGLLEVRDAETGELRVIDTSDSDFVRRYADHAIERLAQNKERFLSVGAGYIEIDSHTSYTEPLRKFFKMRRIRH
ncbi:MAG: DUF58 domain-containing protein [Chlamydiales bacterium]|nr:DUF58 domain-containing protein [Chlamydiia bacterium]MCP5507940.1 DUF58 domain-containing protein [Chlamydiales bacterium]